MKKSSILSLCLFFALALTACAAPGSTASSQAPSSAPAEPSSTPSETSQSAAPESTSAEASEPAPAAPEAGSRVLVAYFSCTGNTEAAAELIADCANAALYEIEAAVPYTADDLNYGDDGSRTTKEQNDDSARPALASAPENIGDYDVIFLGYPIWWGQSPKILYTFLESADFAGKTIVPFCTSGSSGIGSSAENLKASAPDANWLAGQRFSGGASKAEVADWLNGLGLDLPSGE